MNPAGWSVQSLAIVLIRELLFVIFLTSALSKLRSPHHFVSIVQSYHILPTRWARPYALALPWIELMVGLMLLLGLETRIAAGVAGSLFLSFLLAMGINVARGRTEIECGCFGAKRHEKVGAKALARDATLLLLSLLVAWWDGGALTLDGWLSTGQRLSGHSAPVKDVLPLVLAIAGTVMISRLLRQMVWLLEIGS